VTLNDEYLATVNKFIATEGILELRSYGGFFTKFFVQRAKCKFKKQLNLKHYSICDLYNIMI